MTYQRFFALLTCVLALSFSRLIPHPPNFTPILSVGLMAGALTPHKVWGAFIPLAAMLVSDIFLGFHSGMFFVYSGVLGAYWIGKRGPLNLVGLAGKSFVASLWFFVVSNFGVWLLSGMYTHSVNGLIACFIAAIPFFGNTLFSTFLYSAAGFIGWQLLERLLPGVRIQSIAVN